MATAEATYSVQTTLFSTQTLLGLREWEPMYRIRMESRRLHSFDCALFLFHAACTVSAIFRLQSVGGLTPTYFCLGIVATLVNGACAALYATRHGGSTMQQWRRSLRVPLHIAAQLMATAAMAIVLNRPGMVLCSSIWPGYCAIEGFCAHLVFIMGYGTIAAIPLAIVLPMQAAIAAVYMALLPALCRYSRVECPGAQRQYRHLYSWTMKLANSLPFGAPSATRSVDFMRSCPTVLALVELGFIGIVGFYLSFGVEHSSRLAFTKQEGLAPLHSELQRRQPTPWQVLGEMLVAAVLLWHTLTLTWDVADLINYATASN